MRPARLSWSAAGPTGRPAKSRSASTARLRRSARWRSASTRRGCGLLAVRSYPVPAAPYAMDLPPLPYDLEAAGRDAARTLDAALTPWRDKYPAVPVKALTEPGSPARTLVEVSSDAILIIIGSRGHGALVGGLLGSVGQQLLHHADCPVMIVRPGQST